MFATKTDVQLHVCFKSVKEKKPFNSYEVIPNGMSSVARSVHATLQ